MTEFEIPPEYRHLLEVVEPRDQRSDDDILQELSRHAPVTGEKNIWAYWDAGLAAMPGWCKRNAIDWVRMCSPGWTVRVLDNVPSSPNWVLRYVGRDLLAQAFLERTMDGPYVGQHGADLVRGAVLSQLGGAWMDVGSILTRHMDRICWDRIEDPRDPVRAVIAVQAPTGAIMNFLAACRKGDPFFRRWHETFLALWEGRTNLLGIISHPLMAHLKDAPFLKSDPADGQYDFKGPSVVPAVEYAIQIVCWSRLTLLGDAGDGFSPADYCRDHILGVDAMAEAWRAETFLGGLRAGGQAHLDVLTTRLDADRDSDEYRLAEKVVFDVLARSCLQKIVRGGDLTISVKLGTMLDMPENADKDHAPGTFAELLRYGTLHFRQTRERFVERPCAERPERLKKGPLEPFV